MHLILQIIVGGIIGWLASIVMKTNAQMGMIATSWSASSEQPSAAGWPGR
jgi:hypothetical protein